jgi:competence protein ComFC
VPKGELHRLRHAGTSALYHLVWTALDLLFPPSCGGCGAVGARWCPNCSETVSPPPEPLCDICGNPIDAGRSLCRDCRTDRPQFQALRSWSVFEGPVRNVLHRLKYRRDLALGDALAPQLADFVNVLDWNVEIIVPVPLGDGRLRERGYNQAALIARPLALRLGLAYDHLAVSRIRETCSQVGLTRQQRQENVRSAFAARPARVRDRRILLVDDVATTGSTLSSCAGALRASGARDVFALTVARALAGGSREAHAV